MRRFVFLLLMGLSALLRAEVATDSVTAVVRDADTGEPIPYVSVYVSPTCGTISNYDGEFSLQCLPSDVLRITSIGYQRVTCLASELPATVRMKPITTTLRELTVTGPNNILYRLVRKLQKEAGKKQSLMMGVGIVLLSVIAAIILIFKPFSSNSALLQQLGISGNLSNIRTLYIYGEETRNEYELPQFIITSDGLNDLILLDNITVDIGSIEDISDFSKITNLEELCISGNSIRTIEPILGLKKLRFLDISHNYGIDISGISALENLEVLNIAETEIEDIAELRELKNLKTLYVSSDYLETQKEVLNELSAEVVSIDEPVYTFEELKNALSRSDIHCVRIMNSITIPEGEILNIGKGTILRGFVAEGRPELIIDNYGTINIYGGFEMGLCTRNNYGSIIVKDGGVYTGGMCDSFNYGIFTIEKGGIQIHERGHLFSIDAGTYTNEGTLAFGGGGEFRFNDGEFINNGTIIWNLGNFGPSIRLNSGNYVNNGKIYLRDNRGQEDNMSSMTIDDSYKEITMNAINSYNP